MTGTDIPFARQRIVFLMLLVGMALFMVAAAVVLQVNEGKGLGAVPELDQVVPFLGVGLAVAAFTMRAILGRAAANAAPGDRAAKRFVAVMMPLAMLEGGSIAGTTTWLLNGNAVPGLAVGLVLFALAIVMVPFSDPDQAK
jgi:hypothetical protein